MSQEVRSTGAPHSYWREVGTSLSFEAFQDPCVGSLILYMDDVQHQSSQAAKLDM